MFFKSRPKKVRISMHSSTDTNTLKKKTKKQKQNKTKQNKTKQTLNFFFFFGKKYWGSCYICPMPL